MRLEDMDGTPEGTVLDLTPEQATQLRAEYEADEAAKARRMAEDRDEWFRQLARARNAQARGETAWQREEFDADLAWARSVLVDGETFTSGDALFRALYNAKKASLRRSLATSEISRLRRVIVALYPDVAEQTAVAS